MSNAPHVLGRPAPGRLPGGPRRVRDQAREAAALMSFSAATSGALAVALLLVTGLAR